MKEKIIVIIIALINWLAFTFVIVPPLLSSENNLVVCFGALLMATISFMIGSILYRISIK